MNRYQITSLVPRSFVALSLSAVFALAPCSLVAQDTKVAPNPENEEEKEEIVKLSPFEVKVGTNEGYIASETMSRSRVA